MRSSIGIFDLDGTISDDSCRLHFLAPLRPSDSKEKVDEAMKAYHSGLLDDPVLAQGASLLSNYINSCARIVIITARPIRYRAATVEWFTKHFPQMRKYHLLMRRDDDLSTSPSVKDSLLRELFDDFEVPPDVWVTSVSVFDDRADVLRQLERTLIGHYRIPTSCVKLFLSHRVSFESLELEAPDWKAKKAQEKKDNPAFIPGEGLEALARVFSYGSRKYGVGAWRNDPQPPSEHVGSAMRHIASWLKGERRDAESGIPHLQHAMTQLMLASVLESDIESGLD